MEMTKELRLQLALIDQLGKVKEAQRKHNHEHATWVHNERKRIANKIRIIIFAILFFIMMGITGRMDYEAEMGIVHAESMQENNW